MLRIMVAATAVLSVNALALPVAPQVQSMRILHGFGGSGDGYMPFGGVIYHDGYLYGTTQEGGAFDAGILYRVDAITGAETVLHSFSNGADGGNPEFGQVLYYNGALYGVTGNGGAYGGGVVFKYDLATSTQTVIHDFQGGVDGAGPLSGLVFHDGYFFGTTLDGGAFNLGVVYRINASTGKEAVIHSFSGTDGRMCESALVWANGFLYGTTIFGGASGQGTVFRVDPKSGDESVVYSFTGGADGGNPEAGLAYDGSALYGATESGGIPFSTQSGSGVVFKIDPVNNQETVIYSFTGGATGGGPDGMTPVSTMVVDNGALYGTTLYGGPIGDGTVFKIDLATNTETVLSGFETGNDGAVPYGKLTLIHGALYGTNFLYGANGGGTVYRLKLP